MSKLYRVTIEYDALAVADDDIAAYSVARSSLREITDDQEPDICPWAGAIETADQIPKEWRECIPYGGDGNTRVEAYIQAPSEKWVPAQ